ncbi:MAG: 50S ribosomal protein L23 [Candidatus Paceibacterota bacterium]
MKEKTQKKDSQLVVENKIRTNWQDIAGILVALHVTEKASGEEAQSKYIFRVLSSANKILIKNTIEKLYNKKVVNVSIINAKRKLKKKSGKIGYRPGYKKAIVTLKKGEKIDLFAKKIV